VPNSGQQKQNDVPVSWEKIIFIWSASLPNSEQQKQNNVLVIWGKIIFA
jgi:hypothetical protein